MLTIRRTSVIYASPTEKSRPANRLGIWGFPMHSQMIEAGDLHADLWEGLTIFGRRIDGPNDVTVGVHGQYGLCVISHFGYSNHILWQSTLPISQSKCFVGHGRTPLAADEVLNEVLNELLPLDDLDELFSI